MTGVGAGCGEESDAASCVILDGSFAGNSEMFSVLDTGCDVRVHNSFSWRRGHSPAAEGSGALMAIRSPNSKRELRLRQVTILRGESKGRQCKIAVGDQSALVVTALSPGLAGS